MTSIKSIYFDECATLQLLTDEDADAENSENNDYDTPTLIANTASLVRWHQQDCTKVDDSSTCETTGPFWSTLNDFALVILQENVSEEETSGNLLNNSTLIAFEWTQNLAQCPSISSLYASFMCNPEGTGLEVALFEDDSCTVYNPHVSYQDLVLDAVEEQNQQENDEQQQSQSAYDADYSPQSDLIIAWKVIQSSQTRARGHRKDIHNAIVHPFVSQTDCSSSKDYNDNDDMMTTPCIQLQRLSVDSTTCEPILNEDDNNEDFSALFASCWQLLSQNAAGNTNENGPEVTSTPSPIYQVDGSGRLFTYHTSAFDRAMNWITHPLVEMVALAIIATVLLRAVYDIYRDEDGNDKKRIDKTKQCTESNKVLTDPILVQKEETGGPNTQNGASSSNNVKLSWWQCWSTPKPPKTQTKAMVDEESDSGTLEPELVPANVKAMENTNTQDGETSAYKPPSSLGATRTDNRETE